MIKYSQEVNMKIKMYPIPFTDIELREIEAMAGKGNIKRFILEAIEEKKQRYDKKYTPSGI